MLKDVNSLYFQLLHEAYLSVVIEYIDELTLGKAIKNRIDFSKAIKK